MSIAELQRLADEELMPQIAAKNADAFEVFYDRHGRAAYSLAYRIVGNPQVAEDVVQEALISIWRSGGRFDPTRGSLRTWTLGVVRNRAIDMLRRDASRIPKLAFDPQELLDQKPAEASTDGEVEDRETARELQGAIAELPPDQSRVITLAYFGGFSHSEIAEMEGEALGTVKGRMRLGIGKIRDVLTEGIAGALQT